MTEAGYNIRFVGVELLSKNILEFADKLEEKEDFGYSFLVDMKLALQQKAVAIVTNTGITHIRSGKEVATFKIVCFFELPDFDTVIEKVEDMYTVPIELEILLKSLGLSTMRGIMISEVMGTYLQGTIFPLIDMNKLIRDQRK